MTVQRSLLWLAIRSLLVDVPCSGSGSGNGNGTALRSKRLKDAGMARRQRPKVKKRKLSLGKRHEAKETGG